MHPDILQSLAAERVRDMRKRAARQPTRARRAHPVTATARAGIRAGRRLAHL
jgi:hypothetical protein